MKKSLLARTGAAAAVIGVLIFGFTPAANAATPAHAAAAVSSSVPAVLGPVADSGPNQPESVCGTTSTSASSSALLPVARWSDATSTMHSRLDGGILSDSAELIQRNGVSNLGMGAGNFMWNTAAGLSSFAINFCIMDQAGGAADQIGASIGNALLSPQSGVISSIVILGIIVMLFRSFRRNGMIPWKNLVAKGAIVGLFIVMVTASAHSHGGGKNGDNSPYVPGVGSPGWIVTTMNKMVGSLASAPATVLSLNDGDNAAITGDPLSCTNYTLALKQAYLDRYDRPSEKLSSGVPLILSSIWENTGLTTWRTAQFNSMNSGLDRNVWCHMLEQHANSTVVGQSSGTVESIMGRIMRGNTPAADSPVWQSPAFAKGDNVLEDHAAVAWSECSLVDPTSSAGLTSSGAWKMNPQWSTADNSKNVTSDDCAKFWSGPDPLDAFDWPSNGSDANKLAGSNQDVATFVRTLHGNDNSAGLTAIMAYNLAALGMLIVFGAIAGAIIVAKLALVVMIIIMFFVLIMALAPAADMGKIGGTLKTMLGMNIFVFSVQLIFAFIAVFTKLLQQVGSSLLGGDTSLIATIWSGLSPLMAVFIMHTMFTKVMKVPSPFTLSGGLSWGNMAGGTLGGAAFSGISSLLDRGTSRLKGRATGAAKGAVGAGKRGMGTALSAASGGRIGSGMARRNVADPSTAGNAALKASQVVAGKKAVEAVSGAGVTAPAAPADETVEADQSQQQAPVEEAAPQRAGVGANMAPTGPIDHRHFAASSVPNSQLTKGRMTHTERKAMKIARDDERKAAWQHEWLMKEEAGLNGPDTRLGKAAEFVRTSVGNAAHDFRTKPGRTLAKVGGAAALTAATGAAAPVIYGIYKAGQAIHRDTVGSAAAHDRRVADFRAAMQKAQGTNKNTAPAAGAPADKKSQESTTNNGSGPATPDVTAEKPRPNASDALADGTPRPGQGVATAGKSAADRTAGGGRVVSPAPNGNRISQGSQQSIVSASK